MEKYYYAFEAGGRAGLSAELFFRQFNKMYPYGDILFCVDNSEEYRFTECENKLVIRIPEDVAMSTLRNAGDTPTIIFPADELTRQSNEIVRNVASQNQFSKVSPELFNKNRMAQFIRDNLECEYVRVPLTFDCEDIFLRPNEMSAGSKGLVHLENYCACEYHKFIHEYVVDVDFANSAHIDVYVRQVVLKNGYDKYIKFVYPDSYLYMRIRNFVEHLSVIIPEYGRGSIFHVQIGEDEHGQLWYIESSKRISGTSMVHMLFGYNPFCSIANEDKPKVVNVEYGQWYSYEQLLMKVSELIK